MSVTVRTGWGSRVLSHPIHLKERRGKDKGREGEREREESNIGQLCNSMV